MPPPPDAMQLQAPPTFQSDTMSNFRSGFKRPEELAPPSMPPHDVREAMSASMQPPRIEERYEPAKQPVPGLEEGIFGTGKFKAAPHIYIRVNKYQEVMEAVNDLHRKIINAKEDLEDLHQMNKEESGKLKDAAEVVLKIEDLLRYLETTFTSPEA
jgi:hypothetical protein